MNYVPLSQIHLVPFTKKRSCMVHPVSMICSSFCLVGPVGICLLEALTKVGMGEDVLLSQLAPDSLHLLSCIPRAPFMRNELLTFMFSLKTGFFWVVV